MTTDRASPRADRTSPDAVRTATFSRARHGFDEEEVQEFLVRLSIEIHAADAERASLRAQVATLEDEVARLQSGDTDDEQAQQHISVRAVNLLSQAQQAADKCVAEGEQYARELISGARRQYQEILERAQQAAADAAATPPPVDIEAVRAPGYDVALPEVDYVRTYAQVAHAQLRSVIDALSREVDKLGRLARLTQESTEPETVVAWQRAPASTGEATWYPHRSAPGLTE